MRPAEETLQKLVEYKVASINNGKYVYAPEFEKSVQTLHKKKLSRRKQLKYGRKARSAIAPLLRMYSNLFLNKRNIENLITSYVCFHVHIERLGIKHDKSLENMLVYSTWYLNDNEPEVLDQ